MSATLRIRILLSLGRTLRRLSDRVVRVADAIEQRWMQTQANGVEHQRREEALAHWKQQVATRAPQLLVPESEGGSPTVRVQGRHPMRPVVQPRQEDHVAGNDGHASREVLSAGSVNALNSDARAPRTNDQDETQDSVGVRNHAAEEGQSVRESRGDWGPRGFRPQTETQDSAHVLFDGPRDREVSDSPAQKPPQPIATSAGDALAVHRTIRAEPQAEIRAVSRERSSDEESLAEIPLAVIGDENENGREARKQREHGDTDEWKRWPITPATTDNEVSAPICPHLTQRPRTPEMEEPPPRRLTHYEPSEPQAHSRGRANELTGADEDVWPELPVNEPSQEEHKWLALIRTREHEAQISREQQGIGTWNA